MKGATNHTLRSVLPVSNDRTICFALDNEEGEAVRIRMEVDQARLLADWLDDHLEAGTRPHTARASNQKDHQELQGLPSLSHTTE